MSSASVGEACVELSAAERQVERAVERGVPEGNFGSPAGFADAAGRVWFGTIAGTVSFDSAAFPFDKVHPAIRIERVAVDGARRPPMPRMELPPGTARVRLDYTTFARVAPAIALIAVIALGWPGSARTVSLFSDSNSEASALARVRASDW